MRRTLIALLLLAQARLLDAQAPGVITRTSNITINVSAGAMTCAVTNTQPAPATGVHIACQSGASKVTQDALIPSSGSNGAVASFVVGPDSVGIILTPGTAPAINYQIVANGTLVTGTF